MKQVIVAGLFSLMILSVLLPGESFSREDGNVVIDVENSVPVKDEAVAEARSNAIQGALQKAAEQATGSWLTPEIMREKAKTLRGNIFLKADQYIQNYRIISENAYAGVYTLIVRVTVSLDSIKNDLRTLGLGKELPPGLPSVPVLITIRGIKNYQDYSQLREFMKTGLKSVDEIHPRSIAWGTASIEVYIQGGAAVMAAELVKVKQFPIKATIAGDNAIEVVFIR
jgi:hypothetical protein